MDTRNTLGSILRKHGFQCTPKQYKWCLAFTDPTSKGWSSAAEAAKLAGYEKSCWYSAGIENWKKFRPALEEWLDFTDVERLAVKSKLFALMDAKEMKFFASNGLVIDEREVDALSIQLKAATEAGKLIGAYAPDKVEQTVELHDAADRLRRAEERLNGLIS